MPPAAKKAKNPFYALVLIVGIGFLLTACAYTVLAFLDVRGHGDTAARSGLLTFLSNYGIMLFGIELGVLCAAMVGAFATEDYWQRRLERWQAQDAEASHASAVPDTPGTAECPTASASVTSRGNHVD